MVDWQATIQRTNETAHRSWQALKAFVLETPVEPFPLKRALSGYDRHALQHDLRAGLNTALLAFPQAMAFALIAGLPLTYGIMCASVAAIIGPLLSSSRFIMLGPTNATAFMVFSYFSLYPELDPKAM